MLRIKGEVRVGANYFAPTESAVIYLEIIKNKAIALSPRLNSLIPIKISIIL